MSKLKREMTRQFGTAGMKRAPSRLEMTAGFDQLINKVNQLEERLTQIGQREAWAGIWRKGGEYPGGVFATHGGVLFFSLCDTSQQPGTKDSGWAMFHKSHGKAR